MPNRQDRHLNQVRFSEERAVAAINYVMPIIEQPQTRARAASIDDGRQEKESSAARRSQPARTLHSADNWLAGSAAASEE